MAELQTALAPSAPSGARRKGFLAFCALVAALIALLALAPLRATASHDGERAAADPDRRVASTRGAATEPQPVVEPAEPTTSRLDRLVAAGLPIRCGAGTRPLVALTFDDGPGVLTPDALHLLRERGMTATFFLAGKLLDEARFQGLPAAAARLGALGDHSWDHVSMLGLSADELEAQIARTRRAIAAQTGERVVPFRPPLGQHDERVRDYVRSLGMLTVLWSVESGDSQGVSADRIYRTVRDSLSPGDIVLLHDNRGTTQEALPRILDLIEARGYTTVTVPQLLALDPPTHEQLREGTCPA